MVLKLSTRGSSPTLRFTVCLSLIAVLVLPATDPNPCDA